MTNSFENFEEIEKKACQVELPLDVERDVRMPLLVLREELCKLETALTAAELGQARLNGNKSNDNGLAKKYKDLLEEVDACIKRAGTVKKR